MQAEASMRLSRDDKTGTEFLLFDPVSRILNGRRRARSKKHGMLSCFVCDVLQWTSGCMEMVLGDRLGEIIAEKGPTGPEEGIRLHA